MYLYIAIEKLEKFGEEAAHNCVLTTNKNLTKAIKEGLKSGFYSKLLTVPKDILFKNIYIDVNSDFDKEIDFFGDIEIENQIYRLKINEPLETFVKLSRYVDILKGGYLEKTEQLYFIDYKLASTKSEDVKEFLEEVNRERKAETRSVKITKSTIQPFTIYEDKYGQLYYVLGVISQSTTPNKRWYWLLSSEDDSNKKLVFTKEELFEKIRLQNYYFLENLKSINDVGSFISTNDITLKESIDYHNNGFILYDFEKDKHKSLQNRDFSSNILTDVEKMFVNVMHSEEYMSLLKNKKTNNQSVIQILLTRYKTNILEMIKNWHNGYDKKYENYLNDFRFTVDNFIDYIGLIMYEFIPYLTANFIYEKKKDLPLLEEELISPKILFTFVSTYLIDKEQTGLYNIYNGTLIYSHDTKYSFYRFICPNSDFHDSWISDSKITTEIFNYNKMKKHMSELN